MLKNFLILAVLLLASIEDLYHLQISNAFSLSILLLCKRPHIEGAVLILLIWILSAVFVSVLDLQLPFGAGDAKLFASLAFSLGLSCCVKIFIAASLMSGLAAALLLLIFCICKKFHPASKLSPPGEIPFAPFIASGFVITVLFHVF